MKKIYILFFLLCSLSFTLVNRTVAQTGATCAEAQIIATLPFAQTGLSTTANNYNALPCATGILGNYISGNDYVFTYTPSVNETVTITLANTNNAASIFVTDVCPDVAASCIGSSIESITHVVANLTLTAGTQYYITVSSLGGVFGAQTINFDIDITICGATPVADFTYSNVDTVVTFTNTSTDGVTYEWLFGDEVLNNWLFATAGENQVHTYAQFGTYTVQMVATNSCGSTDTTSQTITLVCPQNNPVANFTYSNVDTIVTFANTSTDGVTYEWLFGDEVVNNWLFATTGENQVHSYSAYGTYVVQMVATNSCGITDTISQTITLVCPGNVPVADFTYSDLGGGSYQFTSTSIDAISYEWYMDYPPGMFLAAQYTTANASHSFLADGDYTVYLIVYNPCGSDTMSVLITVVGVTSVGEMNSYNSVRCYPNPAKSLLTVEIDNADFDTQLIITNILGSEILHENSFKSGTLKKQIDVSRFTKGIYFLKVMKNSGTNITRFVVE